MEVKRATFEEINKSQIEFIFNILQKLEEQNETVAKESRSTFFDLFAFALVGKGLDYPFIFEYNGGRYDLGSLSIMARKLAYFETNQPVLDLKGNKKQVPIRVLWRTLRECMYKPMDEALTLGLRSSAELIGSGGGSHSFNPSKDRRENKE